MAKQTSTLAVLAADRRAAIERETAADALSRRRSEQQALYGHAKDRASGAIDVGDGKALTTALLDLVAAAREIEAVGAVPNLLSNDTDTPFSQMAELAAEWEAAGELKAEVGKLFLAAVNSPKRLPALCRSILAEQVLRHEVFMLVGALACQARAKRLAPPDKKGANHDRNAFLLAEYERAVRQQKGKGAPTYKAAADAWNARYPNDPIGIEAARKAIKREQSKHKAGDIR
jgi:hypothetical protein